MDLDPRRSIARLAAAVMAADARVTTSELAAVTKLVRLGLGSLEGPTREELARCVHEPIDVAPACAALIEAYPDAGPTILAALAEIAASDGQLDPRELALLASIGEALGVPPPVVHHLVEAAAVAAGAALPSDAGPPAAAAAPPAPPTRPSTPPPAAVAAAYAALGLEPGASPTAVERAYRVAIERYQPIKVVDLGPEFAVLAVRRLAAATAAFAALNGIDAGV